MIKWCVYCSVIPTFVRMTRENSIIGNTEQWFFSEFQKVKLVFFSLQLDVTMVSHDFDLAIHVRRGVQLRNGLGSILAHIWIWFGSLVSHLDVLELFERKLDKFVSIFSKEIQKFQKNSQIILKNTDFL